jgi:hypothetical protein
MSYGSCNRLFLSAVYLPLRAIGGPEIGEVVPEQENPSVTIKLVIYI